MTTWEQFVDELQLTDEEQQAIEIEKEIIRAMIALRKTQGLSQAALAEKCHIKQPALARMERLSHSPRLDSLLRILLPLGYTLRIEPLENDAARL